MRKKCKLIAGMLAATMLSTTVAGWSTPTFAAETSAITTSVIKEESDEYLTGTYEGDEYFGTFVEDAEIQEFDKEFPKSVDLTKSEYAPEVGDQKVIPNCGYWSNYHTNWTYTYNKKNGIETTDGNTINPNFSFAFYGRAKESSHAIDVQIGHPTRKVYPVDYEVFNTFVPTKEVWEDALQHRVAKWVDYKTYGDEDDIIEGPDDPSLNVMKQLLANGLIFSYGSSAYQWSFAPVASENFKGENAISRVDGEGNNPHGVSMVGYNDEIWIDINYDGIVQKAEMGAFKMVNSWGPEWENGGYVWVAYDAFNKKSLVITEEDEIRINKEIDAKNIKANKINSHWRRSFMLSEKVSTIKPREKNTSNCWCYISVNTGSRKEMTMSVTATKKSDGTKKTYNFPSLIYESENLAWDASENSTDATMVFDLDNLIEDISVDKMDDYTWETTFGDTKLDEYSVTVEDVYFTVNGAKKYVTDVSKIPLNGSSKTYKMDLRTADRKEDVAIIAENQKNVTIYYDNASYKDTSIHYRVGSGTWTTAPGMQMCRTDEQSGYKYKYVINLGSASNMTACFNNRNGLWDNNGSKDYTFTEPGCYGIKNGTVTKLTEPVKEKEPLIELDKSNITLKVSEETTIIPTVIDGSKNDIVWSSSNENVAKVIDGKVTAIGEGTAIITARIGEAKVICEVKVEKRIIPLAGTLTVAGSKDALTKELGSKITLDAKGIGGSEKYTYKFAVLNADTGKWSILQDFNNNASYVYTLNYAGTKQFAVTVKDSSGKTVATNRITVKVIINELTGRLSIMGLPYIKIQEKGSKITLSAKGNGGSGSYTYKFAVLNVDTGKWSVLRNFNTNASYTYALNYPGTKQFAVTVKDSRGKTVATNRITVKVANSPYELMANLTVNNKTENITAKVGDSVKLDVNAAGGTGSYSYKYVVYNVDTNTWFTLKDYNNSYIQICSLSSAGTKQFVVSVKDNNTGKVVSSKRVTVKVNK